MSERTNRGLIGLFSDMVLIRSAEEIIAEHFLAHEIASFVHFTTGQEAIAASVCGQTAPGDRVFGNHRSHGHYLATGGNLAGMFAEMLGLSSGCCKGAGGSMHLLDRSAGFFGSTPILGSAAPIAAGSGFQQKLSGVDGITICFIGDGASEEGVVAETLNLLGVLRLPVLLVIEDNGYSVQSPVGERRPSGFDFGRWVESYCLRYFSNEDYDPEGLFSCASEALAFVRNSRAPAVLYAKCFRYRGHSSAHPEAKVAYRLENIEVARQNHDPVELLRSRMVTQGLTTFRQLDKLSAEVSSAVRQTFSDVLAQISPLSQEGEG